MKLLVGLGNPGEKYKNNRHNTGFMFLDFLTKAPFQFDKYLKAEIFKSKDIIYTKPQTFMNDSGQAVKSLVDYFKINLEDLFVVHDDLDLKLGEYKIQKGIGPKLHNGISSIEESIGTKDFWRLRIGVDNRDPENRIPGETYVLQDFLPEELKTLSGVFVKIQNEKNIGIN